MQIQTGQEQFQMTASAVEKAAFSKSISIAEQTTWFNMASRVLGHYLLGKEPTELARDIEAMGYKQDIIKTEP